MSGAQALENQRDRRRPFDVMVDLDMRLGCSMGFALEAMPGGELGAASQWIQVAREAQFLTHPRGRFELTADHFRQMVANHKKYGVDPAVDREHESWFSWEASDARGWARELDVREDPKRPGKVVLVARVEWTDLGASEVKKKYFRYVSAGLISEDFDRETGEPIGAVLDHIAICKNPFIQGMEPLSLSNVPGPGRAKEQSMNELMKYLRSLYGCPADADESAVLVVLKKREGDVKVLFEKGLGLHLSKEALSAIGCDASSTAEKVSEQILGSTKLLEAATAEKVKLELAKIEAVVDAAIKEFKLTPAERDEFIALGKDSPKLFERALKLRVPQPEAARVQLADPKERGASLDAQQDKAIAAYQAEHKEATYTEAMLACKKAQPELFRDQVAGGKGA